MIFASSYVILAEVTSKVSLDVDFWELFEALSLSLAMLLIEFFRVYFRISVLILVTLELKN